MADNDSDDSIVPKWKRDLLIRRKAAAGKQQQLSSGGSTARSPDRCSVAVGCASGHQPQQRQPARNQDGCFGCPSGSSCSSSVAAASLGVGAPGACGICNRNIRQQPEQLSTCSGLKRDDRMVQERSWIDNKQVSVDMVSNTVANGDSDSSEELQYGPGIVSKLKNRYLSLTLREQTAKVRPSILPLRKATSLENLLDDDAPIEKPPSESRRLFESRVNGTNGNAKNVPNRYRNATRGCDMKRARSVETISRTNDIVPVETANNNARPKSFHEDVLIIDKEGNDKPHRKIHDNNGTAVESKVYSARINRPKRIAPVMNEKEKPPADVVKHTKKIFEARPELRTRPPHHTGEVAAKVATYKNIIIQTKVSSKPPLKQKPALPSPRKSAHPPVRLPLWKDKAPDVTKPKIKSPLQSPIPDVSMINEELNEGDKKTTSSLSETPDLILHSSPVHLAPKSSEDFDNLTSPLLSPLSSADSEEEVTTKRISPESQSNISKASHSITFNFNKNVPPTQPLKLEINGTARTSPTQNHSPLLKQTKPRSPQLALSPREIEKNFINTAKTLEQLMPAAEVQQPTEVPSEKVVVDVDVVEDKEQKCETVAAAKPKRQARPPRPQEEQNCVVFKFTDRKDVPDYIGNDGTVRTSRIERPKAGEGGITLLPGASIDESFTDYDEEMLSLEGPPSPCDVNFINDNILIDGRSSLSQKTKKPKMKIQFVEAVPQIFEYPSEASMLLDVVGDQQQTTSSSSPTPPQATIAPSGMGHAVPSLSGSSLANYTPKSSYSTEDFQLGVTKTAIATSPESTKPNDPADFEPEMEEPIMFSSGGNTDILF